ncbi:MAG: hypothetical protein LBC69_00145 [Eubacteriaceae bacterium]|jgi:cell division protein FtsB|nr:hypothetical protein [Eubacteriaceae bacterium]
MAPKRKIRYRHNVFAFLLVLLLAIPFLYNTARYQSTLKKQRETAAELEIAKRAQENLAQLYEAQISLQGSETYLEYIAHKNLGYIFPGEKVLDLESHQEGAEGEKE